MKSPHSCCDPRLSSRATGLTMRVILPLKSRVVGFGANGVVYVARTDEDDLQHLQRFVLR